MSFEYASDRIRAERVLRGLFVGAKVGGIRFGPIPQLLISDSPPGKPVIHGQVYLNLGSAWCIYPQRPAVFPRAETEIAEREEAEELRQLCELRETVIAGVELAPDAPDLAITFEDGRVFFISGRHDRYETWDAGIAFSPVAGTLVVACPGNEVAVWDLPEEAARDSA